MRAVTITVPAPGVVGFPVLNAAGGMMSASGNIKTMKLVVIVIAALLSPLNGAWAATQPGTVVGITDGDTLTVLDAEKKRYKITLIATDAPERNQPFGTTAKQNLAKLVLHKEVAIEVKKRARNKRIFAKILLDETGADCAFRSCLKSLDVGLQQIRDGLAWYAKESEQEQSAEDRGRYAAAEQAARTGERGLWADAARAVPPWQWRLKKR